MNQREREREGERERGRERERDRGKERERERERERSQLAPTSKELVVTVNRSYLISVPTKLIGSSPPVTN